MQCWPDTPHWISRRIPFRSASWTRHVEPENEVRGSSLAHSIQPFVRQSTTARRRSFHGLRCLIAIDFRPGFLCACRNRPRNAKRFERPRNRTELLRLSRRRCQSGATIIPGRISGADGPRVQSFPLTRVKPSTKAASGPCALARILFA